MTLTRQSYDQAAWKHGPRRWILALLSCAVAATALADPGDRALERLSVQLPADGGLVVTRYLIDEFPMYRLDEAGQPVFDPALLSAVVRNAAGQDSWRDGTWLVVTKDKTGLLVRQSSDAQARIAAAMRKLYEQRGIIATDNVAPDERSKSQ
jgi:hypothetical protein